MRKFRRLMSFLVAMVLVLGCASSAFAWAPEWEHDEDLSDYKLCDNFGDIKLTVAVVDHSSIEDWETNSYVKWLEEVTNVDLSFELIPFENRAEKLSLILSSGEYPDIFLTAGTMTDAMVSKYGVEEGMFLPLGDLIEKYGKFTKQVFEEYPGTQDRYTQPDGNIYSLPEVNECYHCKLATKAWINEQWLKNLGLEKPATLDEFRKVLEAFRDQDANGNGDATDEIPFAGDYQDGWFTNGRPPDHERLHLLQPGPGHHRQQPARCLRPVPGGRQGDRALLQGRVQEGRPVHGGPDQGRPVLRRLLHPGPGGPDPDRRERTPGRCRRRIHPVHQPGQRHVQAVWQPPAAQGAGRLPERHLFPL